MGRMSRAWTSASSAASPRRYRMPPWMRGWSVFTRPPRISGACVNSPTGVTFRPASARARCVPPVDRSSMPRAARRRAKGTRWTLSETDRMARRTMGAPPGRVPLVAFAGAIFKDGEALVLVVLREGRRSLAWGRGARLILGDGAELRQPPRLDLPDALPGEIHDGAHLFERDPAAV